jgi:hypothetical protein
VKTAISLIALACLLLISCKKSHIEPIGNNLVGRWSYAQYYQSVGGPGEWRNVDPAHQTIEFRADGTFLPSPSFLPAAKAFRLVDSATISIQPASSTISEIVFHFVIDTPRRELVMYQTNPACFEGCAYKFRK